MSSSYDIGMVGLGVMGRNLALNIARKGFKVIGFDTDPAKVKALVDAAPAGQAVGGTSSLEELAASLAAPRKIMMMVPAGKAVDQVIDGLLGVASPGDILIDGGNSHFPDTNRRQKTVEAKGLLFIGTGVSGGEEGALKGPSIMPGGSPAAWPHVKTIFQKIAAKTDAGEPCCDWVGENGAGHFVKMVHNGIEYGDMQMICEAYHLMKDGLGLSNDEMHEVFAQWNKGKLNSYLIEITRDILAYRDADGNAVIDQILDSAGQKGTGKWTAINALDLGQPLTLIGEAVFARCLSSLKDERIAAASQLAGPKPLYKGDREELLRDLEDALYASKIISYTQGYQLMRAAAGEYGWNLNYGGIALMWRGGCIIRSVFLERIKEAFAREPDLSNLLLDPFFKEATGSAQSAWRRVVAASVSLGIPMPAMGAALSFYDGYRCARLPANLLQAQRDYFGAHTYERVDRPRGEHFHTQWLS